MLFNSFNFLIFLPLFLVIYFAIPRNWQLPFTLAASLVFYMAWKPEYLLLILYCATVNYFGAQTISKSDNIGYSRRIIYFCIALNMIPIVVFKYLNFFGNAVNSIAQFLSVPANIPAVSLILPVGISFYTFHTLSYTIDVFRKETPFEKNPVVVLLYVVFWPMLLAGPIERSNHLIPQLKKHHTFNLNDTLIGVNRILLGLFKKVVVADRLSAYVNLVYDDLPNKSAASVGLAIFFFTIQIYCDFSGYCDIALGSAKIMGYDLFENFNRPYLARTISQFWDRWHMSLSRWFRDYVYFPLGGSRGVSKTVHYRNVMVTFLASGLWHGANWTFVFWGGLHGILLIIEDSLKPFKWINGGDPDSTGYRISKIIRHSVLFIVISITWVFFRATSFESAFTILTKGLNVFEWKIGTDILVGKGPFSFLLSIVVLVLLTASYLLPKDMRLKHNLLFQLSTTFIILILGKSGAGDFIYFQF